MATAADLQKYVGASDTDTAFVEQCWAESNALVTNFVGSALVPLEVRSRAVLEVGSELYHRRQAPNGVAQYAAADGAPVRVARNPMVGAYPILKPYVGLGIG